MKRGEKQARVRRGRDYHCLDCKAVSFWDTHEIRRRSGIHCTSCGSRRLEVSLRSPALRATPSLPKTWSASERLMWGRRFDPTRKRVKDIAAAHAKFLERKASSALHAKAPLAPSHRREVINARARERERVQPLVAARARIGQRKSALRDSPGFVG